MSFADLVRAAEQAWPLLLAVVLLPALMAGIIGLLHALGRGGDAPWRYLYALAIYLAAIPGMFSATLVLYALLFTGESLLEVNLLVYFGPIAGMAAAFALARRSVDLDEIPGFGRLSGLLLMAAVSFAAVFLLTRLRLWVVFGANLLWFFALALGVFAALKLGAARLFGRRGASRAGQ